MIAGHQARLGMVEPSAMLVPLVLIVAYLLGSIPTALLVSRCVASSDIRTLGDGNMGARNVSRNLGWQWGTLVALVDGAKGLAPVCLAQWLGLSLIWQVAAGFCALLGHDFPLFAGFRGGQGLATTIGVLAALAPLEMALGMLLYGLLFLISRISDVSAGVGVGLMIVLMCLRGRPAGLVVSMVGMILTIPAKTLWDRPRRTHLRTG
jgi:glycerol-3-phosphate acyltransferase PlsY